MEYLFCVAVGWFCSWMFRSVTAAWNADEVEEFVPAEGELEPGLWVRMSAPPSPDSEFVELENEHGFGVGPETGVRWVIDGEHWLLGPFEVA